MAPERLLSAIRLCHVRWITCIPEHVKTGQDRVLQVTQLVAQMQHTMCGTLRPVRSCQRRTRIEFRRCRRLGSTFLKAIEEAQDVKTASATGPLLNEVLEHAGELLQAIVEEEIKGLES